MRTRGGAALFAALFACAACNERPRAVPASGGGGSDDPLVLPEPVRIVAETESSEAHTPKEEFAPFEVAEDEDASGGRCVVLAEKWATDGELHPAYKTREGGKPVSAKLKLDKNPLGKALVPNGTVAIPFEVKKAGSYVVHVRAWFHCSCGNSFHLSVDEDAPVDTDGDGVYDENPPYTLSNSTYKRWKWVKLRAKTFDLAEGPHVVRIFNREDGLKIDQVLLAEIMEGPVDEYIPQGIEASHP